MVDSVLTADFAVLFVSRSIDREINEDRAAITRSRLVNRLDPTELLRDE